jgi:hypothetical protein
MKSHTWTNLTHVCRKWCAVARSHRPPVWIWGLLSDISRQSCRVICRFPSTTIARMKTSLEVPSGACVPHSDITIACVGSFLQGGAWIDKFIGVTNCSFPILKSLSLRIRYNKQKLPDTFFRGPDLSDLHLRRLTLDHALRASVSRFLSSATALTNLYSLINTAFSPSAETSLLPCLQGMFACIV